MTRDLHASIAPTSQSRLRPDDTQDRRDTHRLLLLPEHEGLLLRERLASRRQALIVVEGVAHHLVLVGVEKVMELDFREVGDVAAWRGDGREFVDVDV